MGVTTANRINNIDIDTILESGVYYIGTGCANAPQPYSQLIVTPARGKQQFFICGQNPSNADYGCMMRRVWDATNDVFLPWEWVNPPMELGVEYRTTERISGKAVYKRKVDAYTGIQYRLDGETTWHYYSELNGIFCHTLSIDAGATVRFSFEGTMLMMGRIQASSATIGVYVLSSYAITRAPLIATLSQCEGTTITTGGNNTDGWYVDVSNSSVVQANFQLIGRFTPTILA